MMVMSIPFMYGNTIKECSGNQTEIKEITFYMASDIVKKENEIENKELNINSPIEQNGNSGFNIVEARIDHNKETKKQNDVIAALTHIESKKQYMSGKVYLGIPYYAVHLSLNKDILKANFIADIHSIKKENRTYKCEEYSYNTHSTINQVTNDITLNGYTQHNDVSGLNMESEIVEHKEDVVEINKIEHKIEKTNNVVVESNVTHTIDEQRITANIIHNQISLKGYVNGEYVLPLNEVSKERVITIEEGWNIIDVPAIIRSKPARIKDFIETVAEIEGKHSHEIFDVAILIENNKEKTYIVSEEYTTDIDSENNFALYTTNENKIYSRPFMIKSNCEVKINNKDLM